MLHTGDRLLVVKAVVSLRPERDLGLGPFCAGALRWTPLWVWVFFVVAQINTFICSKYFFYKRVFLSPLFSKRTVLVHSNAILYVELNEVLLSSSGSRVVGAPRWPQGRRVGDKCRNYIHS